MTFIEEYIIPLKNHRIDYLERNKHLIKSPFLFAFIECQLEKLKNHRISDSTYSNFKSLRKSKEGNTFINIIYHINKGDYILSKLKYRDSDVISEYETAYHLSKKYKNKCLSSESLRRICDYFFKTQKNIPPLKESLKRYEKNICDDFDKYKYIFWNIGLKMQENYSQKKLISISLFDSLFLKAERVNHPITFGESFQLKGNYYMLFLKKNDSVLQYYNLAKKEYDKCNSSYCKIRSLGLEINQAIFLQGIGRYEESIKKLDSLKKLKIPNQSLREQLSIYQYLTSGYKSLNDYKNAYKMQLIEKKIEDSLDLIVQKTKISEIQTKYQTAEKEKKIIQLLNTNLKTEVKQRRTRNQLIASISLLALGSIITLLIYKNTRRKQRIAEQQREIEIQKTEKLLKEQELASIDAMIAGQEKERQRLANDLHDNLGSTLATVKLHFQHLKNNKDNSETKNITELYNKTDNLLEEAYQKVRTIAHEKNSGVMAKQGLLPAIKKLAKKVSNSNELLVEVQDYGLEKRLDNTLEITIFRMIQELITNIIKHAHATEIHISLTNHDSLLNIIVEDNGKGFDAKVLPEKDGMGLATIEKRVEHLEGTFEIDSTLGKGTNIIINIPI
ncbi:sensor histidine kinase [Aquimarina sp. 2304DJ70-9]|uniref:sensor histidine kinase n=1 Tax=Aquimarina penaris TaxID=3231044 RepID=UPI003462180D